MNRCCFSGMFVAATCLTGSGVASETAAAGEAGAGFFREKVRPILVVKCLSCHGPDKKKGDLDLSRRALALEGGANGSAVIPGKAATSLLFKKVSSGKMPPDGALPPEQIEVLKKWLDDGAAYDSEPLVASGKKLIDVPWSFRPLTKPTPPRTLFDQQALTPVDRFLFARLESKKLKPSPPADRLALLRRVTFDLTGLPPSPETIDAFLQDRDTSAYDKVIDRLLASDAYGERWGRHWLDVVRFGESHGYEQNHLRPNAWPYRDYVIRALNEDKPFNRFIVEQLAGDVVGKGDPQIEAATGFLVAGVHDTVGNGAEEGRRQQRANDLEDMVATVGAAFLGLTVNCAKCHDHKFDPIPQKDFYHMTAVFAGVRHGERPLTSVSGGQQKGPSRKQGQDLLRSLRGDLDDLEAAARVRVLADQGAKNIARPAVNTRRNVEDFPATRARFVRFTILATKDGAQPCMDELEIYGPDRKENLALSAHGAKATASTLLPGYPIHQVRHLNDGLLGNSWSWISNEPGCGWVQIELAKPAAVSRIVWSRDGLDTPMYQDRLPTKYFVQVSLDGKAWEKVSEGADRAAAPEAIAVDVLRKAMTADEGLRYDRVAAEVEKLRHVVHPTMAQAYVGQFTAPDPIYVLKRGDVMNRGELVEPASLSRIPGLTAELDSGLVKTESGRRLALAQWIADPANPLTARVLVNRVWQYHFGRGLVGTSSDFGNNGERPSHPELLDWLAQDFIANGWKLKRLHKMLVTSYAYRQTSHVNDQGQAIDADNQLLWRMPLRRLEAEALRDAILAVSGKLDRKMGGPGFLLFKYKVVNVAIYQPLEEHGPSTWRRTVYATSARAIREEMLANFDCPECAQRTPRRDHTTTPLQALSLLNGAFTTQQAKFFAERVVTDAGAQRADQVQYAFRLAFGREPSQAEQRGALKLVDRHGLAALCRALLNANEFLYY